MTTWIFDRTKTVGRLEIVDHDRLKLLHNMSTNDFNSLREGEGRATVLTTALARIIDQVIVYHRGDTALMLTNAIGIVRPWLQRHIFWNDKVKLRDVSTDLAQIEIHGADATTLANSLTDSADSMSLHQFKAIYDGAGFIARIFALDGDGFVIVVPNAMRDSLIADLVRVEAVGATLSDDATYEQLRIASGLPSFGHELTEEYIPLEAGLWDSVSFSKGCYIGQEIIARMESRNKLAKMMVKLELDAPVKVGSDLQTKERSVGTITSITALADGKIIGLGYIKTDVIEGGSPVFVSGDAEHEGLQQISVRIS